MRQVLIAGAGIGGLTAALSLHAAGIEATVIESARTIAPLGVGINLQPQAVAALIELGLGDRLAATALPTAEHVYYDSHGRHIHTEPRGIAAGHAAPQYSVHRGELQLMLLEAVCERLGSQAVQTGMRLVDVSQDGDRIHAEVLNRATGKHETRTASVLLGAEGLHSAVRAKLHPDAMSLHWSGVRMWRGMAEADPFLTGRSLVLANGGAARLVAYPISRRVAEQGRALVNWVASVTFAEPGLLDDDAGVDRAGSAADVLPYFADFELGFLDVSALISATSDILEYPMVDRDPLPQWGTGRVTLLGDAAHPMYPVGANGASQAILDAHVVARELAADGEPVAALARYEQHRRAATGSVVLANREMDIREREGATPDELTGAYRRTVDAVAAKARN